MDFQQLADVAEKWCSHTPFELIATEETERRMDFYADPGVSFYVLCPDNGCGDNFVSAWGEGPLQRLGVWPRGRFPAPELPHAGEAVGLEVVGVGGVTGSPPRTPLPAHPGKALGPGAALSALRVGSRVGAADTDAFRMRGAELGRAV